LIRFILIAFLGPLDLPCLDARYSFMGTNALS